MKLICGGALDGYAVISFYDPPSKRHIDDYAPIDFSGACENVMKIELHDLDISALKDFGLTQESYFPEAPNVAEFVYRVRQMGLDIICQCEYGQSRSAGCAAAILEHFARRGIQIFADYRYYPNQLVFNKMLKALDDYKKSLN